MRILVLFFTASVCLAADCENLTSLKLKDTTVVSASVAAAGAFTPPNGPQNGPYKTLPSFCRVRAISKPSADS